ncbi:MAG: TRAP transporter small permease subunit [Deltaproteobacteria bacterium]|jgi:TRAP-type mannitol/chloroaromatic compound transport system permease small subunit|nr:TRAP transporter small permease subunit [Deltaproteobacteria bacterium]MBW2476900.1 TRAP transporter small permease subunit [Deltaproteobacteria bacterium]
MLLKLERFFDRFSDLMGWIAGFLNLAMLANVFYDAIMRYFFRSGSIALQEMEWHLFSIVFLFGMAFTLKEDAHVRVDVLYDQFSPRWKAIVNIAGTLFFLIPLSALIVNGSYWFVKEAYDVNEVSGDPGGLAYRWLIKSVIPASFVFLIVSACGFIVRNINIFRGLEAPPVHRIEDDVL